MAVRCPHCRGEGQVFAFASGPTGCEAGYRNCSTCAGRGAIQEWFAEQIEAGKRMRDDRVARGVSLRDEAKRLGIHVIELSAMERGRKAPPREGA